MFIFQPTAKMTGNLKVKYSQKTSATHDIFTKRGGDWIKVSTDESFLAKKPMKYTQQLYIFPIINQTLLTYLT